MSQEYNLAHADLTVRRYSDVDVLSIMGRMGRKRYFVYSLVLPIMIFWAIATIAALASYIPIASNLIFNAIIAIAIFAAIFMLIRLTIQRCHDFDKSGVLAILAIIPFANIIFALIPGKNGLNTYGEVPVPTNWLFNVAFYALVTLMLGIALFAVFQIMYFQF